MATRRGGKKGRKYGRKKIRRPTQKRWREKRMTMQGMMGRKIRAIAKSNFAKLWKTDRQRALELARKHWEQNRKRG